MEQTRIAWTDYTFNPWMGCTRASEGCEFCYAEKIGCRRYALKWGPGAERRIRCASSVVQPPIHSTGIAMLDHVLGGGSRVGELIGLLGPTGGGKTVLGLQLACESMRLSRRVAYFANDNVSLHPQGWEIRLA